MMRTGARPGAIAVSGAIPNPDSQEASGSERFVEATADEANPTRVMATWMVARKLPESAASAAAFAALRSPSSASRSSMARFAVVRAISDMEKKPLTTVSTRVVMMLMVMSMGTVSNLQIRNGETDDRAGCAIGGASPWHARAAPKGCVPDGTTATARGT